MSCCRSRPGRCFRLLLWVIGFLLAGGEILPARAHGAELRSWAIGSGRIKRAYDAVPRSDGGLWLLASSLPKEGRRVPAELSRWAPGGRLLWARTIVDPIPFDIRFRLLPEPGGDVLVTGQSGGAFRIWRFSEEGELLWGQQLATDPVNANETAAPDGEGGVYIALRQPPSGRGRPDQPEIAAGGTRIFHYSAKGLLLGSYALEAVPEERQPGESWLGTEPLGIQTPAAIAAVPTGGVAVVGYFAGISGNPSDLLRGRAAEKLDYGWLSTGERGIPRVTIFVDRWDRSGRRLWSRLFGAMWNNLAFAVTSSERGAVAIAGSSVWGACPGEPSVRPSGLRLFIAEYSGEPATLHWCRQIESALSIGAMALRYGADGSLWLLGEAKGPLASREPLAQGGRVYLAKLDSEGHPLWSRQMGHGTSRPFPHIALGVHDQPVVAWATSALGSRHQSQEGETISVAFLPRDLP